MAVHSFSTQYNTKRFW